MDEWQKEIERIDDGGDAFREEDEIVELTVRRPLDKVIPVRISSDKWAELRREASELGVGPSTLARMWILDKLRGVQAKKKSA